MWTGNNFKESRNHGLSGMKRIENQELRECGNEVSGSQITMMVALIHMLLIRNKPASKHIKTASGRLAAIYVWTSQELCTYIIIIIDLYRVASSLGSVFPLKLYLVIEVNAVFKSKNTELNKVPTPLPINVAIA